MRNGEKTNLPVLSLTLKHHGVLRLADLAIVLLLNLLGALLCLDAVILGECTLVTGTAGVCEEVRADGLDGSLRGGADFADGLEVLLGSPALSEDWKRARDNRGSRHYDFVDGDWRQKVEDERLMVRLGG